MADILVHNAIAVGSYNLRTALASGVASQGSVSTDPTQYANWPSCIPSLQTTNALCIYDSGSGYFRDGACCAWTVPAGASQVRFELWGAGAGTSPGMCCSGSPFGATGAYASLIVSAKIGCVYTLCAGAANSNQSYCHCDRDVSGCQSFVTGAGLSNFCANGGCSNLHEMIRATQRDPAWNCCRYMARCSQSAGACICCTSTATYFCFSNSCSISCCSAYPCITRQFSYFTGGCGNSIWGTPIRIPSMYAADWFDTNFYGCMCSQPTMLPGNCANTVSTICCVSYTSGTCCGAAFGGACTGNRCQPGQGGNYNHVMGGNIGYGDWGRTGMVKVSWC